jgi:hypothetical protein
MKYDADTTVKSIMEGDNCVDGDVHTLTNNNTGETVTLVYDGEKKKHIEVRKGEKVFDVVQTMKYKRWMRDFRAEVASSGGSGKFKRARQENGDGWWMRASISKPVEKTHTTVYDDKTNTHWEVGENDTVESIRELIAKTRTKMDDIKFK